jgi:hypothetical protein
LPFALTFVAIPLETFIHSLRTVLGMFTVALLRTIATLLRIAGTVFRGSGPFLAEVCDALAFLPLWIETKLRGTGETEHKSTKEEEDGVQGIWKSSLEQR